MQSIAARPGLERLLEHEAGLRQRSFTGVNQKQDAVDHREGALDLAAKIRMARSIDDVDPGGTPEDRGILRHDGDAALALERVGIHHAIHQILVGAKYAGLTQHRIDQGGFAVIDVSDDSQVANILSAHFCEADTKVRRAAKARRDG